MSGVAKSDAVDFLSVCKFASTVGSLLNKPGKPLSSPGKPWTNTKLKRPSKTLGDDLRLVHLQLFGKSTAQRVSILQTFVPRGSPYVRKTAAQCMIKAGAWLGAHMGLSPKWWTPPKWVVSFWFPFKPTQKGSKRTTPSHSTCRSFPGSKGRRACFSNTRLAKKVWDVNSCLIRLGVVVGLCVYVV